MNNEVNIGGVKVKAFDSIKGLIDETIFVNGNIKPNIAIAINPEKIMSARSNLSLMAILNKATLRYADGIGVSYVLSRKLNRKVARIPGCELWEALMYASISSQTPVFLVGASESVNTMTKEKLLSQGVNVVGSVDGYFDKDCPDCLIEEIEQSGAKIITVALGSPTQEQFIFDCKKQIPDAFYMGVGGTYDVFTGNVKRAPKFFRKVRCEWLFRLLSQPTRIRRQLNLVKYIALYLTGKL